MKIQAMHKLTALGLIFAAIAITGTATLALHTIKTPPPTKQTHDTTTTSPTNPAQLAADKAAYKASVALAAQLGATYDQAKQVEQAALDQYGDSSQQYQTAKATADTAYDAYQNQLADEASKSLQVTVDGGNPKD